MNQTLFIALAVLVILVTGAAMYAGIRWLAGAERRRAEKVRQERLVHRPKLSRYSVGDMVWVKEHRDEGPRLVVAKMLTCDAVRLSEPVAGFDHYDDDQLEVVQ